MCFFFHETIAYLKGNSKVKEKFFQENSYTEIRKTYFLAPKLGVDLYTGSTYTRVNTVYPSDIGLLLYCLHQTKMNVRILSLLILGSNTRKNKNFFLFLLAETFLFVSIVIIL